MDVRTAGVDVVTWLGLGLGSPGLRQLRAQLFHRRGERLGVAAAAQQRPHPEPADEQRKKPFHVADATVPPLLATPVAPSPEAASTGRGRLSPWEA